MSATSDALECHVAAIRALAGPAGTAVVLPRDRAAIDRQYARLLVLIAPRVRHFIRVYGLLDHREDAEQACAIGLFRAIAAYDGARARFTTFLNWQLRGELQSLRFRLRHDARESARKVSAVTLSYDAMVADGAEFAVPDSDALQRTEALAADLLAVRACGTMVEDYMTSLRKVAIERFDRRAQGRGRAWIQPGTLDPMEIERLEARLARERAIVTAHILGEASYRTTAGLTDEQARQVARRAIRTMSARARGNPRFDPDAFAPPLRAAVH